MAEAELKNEKENMSKSEFKYEVRNEILKQGGGFADLLFITDEIVENALQMGRSAKDVARSILQ